MKRFKLIAIAAVYLLGALPTLAYDFEVDGIYYNKKGTEATVTYGGTSSSSALYSGDVVIPSTVTYDGITYIVNAIGGGAFHYCSSLNSVNISNSITFIGSSAFSSCTSLTDITIPNSVTTIESEAFAGCSGLTDITIGSAVTTIGRNAFTRCTGLARVNVSDIKAWCGISFANAYSNPIFYAHHLYFNGSEVTNLMIPESVSSIGNNAFYGCSGLTSVTIGNSVEAIGNHAFRDCSGLTNVIIGNSVKTIGSYAFMDCKGILRVTIGNSVTAIGGQAFSGCYGLTRVNISDLKAWCEISFGDHESNPLGRAQHLFLDGNEVANLVIPTSITAIKDYAFHGCTGLTSVSIGNTVMSIGSSAFAGCTSLSSIMLGNSVTSIGSYAFSGCKGMTWFTIPNSVTTIGSYAFYNCNGLKRVNISDLMVWCKISFENYYSNPLYCAHHLCLNGNEVTDLVIPSSVTAINNYAFPGCSGLNSVTLGNSVKSVGSYAFDHCTGLTGIVFPKSVESIENYAFSNCTGLADVTCEGVTPPVSYRYTFDEATYSNAVLHIPAEAVEAYDNEGCWFLFQNIEPFSIAVTPGDVDGDGKTSIDDVTLLVDLLLSGSEAPAGGDVDGDGKVTIDDLTVLIDMLLQGGNN